MIGVIFYILIFCGVCNCDCQASSGKFVSVKTPIADIFDKMTILQIKVEKIKHQEKLKIAKSQLLKIEDVVKSNIKIDEEVAQLILQLKNINLTLWDLEDEIRSCNSKRNYGEKFKQCSINIQKYNDERAMVKRKINDHYNSSLKEVKSYS